MTPYDLEPKWHENVKEVTNMAMNGAHGSILRSDTGSFSVPTPVCERQCLHMSKCSPNGLLPGKINCHNYTWLVMRIHRVTVCTQM